MRTGEVLGLSWSDINFAVNKVDLCRQIRYIGERGFFFTTLKTESSSHYILIDDYLLGELRRWQGLSPLVGEKVSLLCTRNGGRLITVNIIEVALKKEGLNAHSFRHTHATQLIESDAYAKGVAGRLGRVTLILLKIFTLTIR